MKISQIHQPPINTDQDLRPRQTTSSSSVLPSDTMFYIFLWCNNISLLCRYLTLFIYVTVQCQCRKSSDIAIYQLIISPETLLFDLRPKQGEVNLKDGRTSRKTSIVNCTFFQHSVQKLVSMQWSPASAGILSKSSKVSGVSICFSTDRVWKVKRLRPWCRP